MKVYEAPDYGRQDATIVAYNATTGHAHVLTIQTERTIYDVPHRSTSDDTSLAYWSELPEDYPPGSEGH